MTGKPMKEEICSVCGGEGMIACPKCKGSGKVKRRYYDLTRSDEEVEEPCMLCEGTGEIPCQQCSKE